MAYTHLDLDVLRSFCTGVAVGSFAQAADKLGRSPSAVSAQLKKLESQAGTALLRKVGRGLELTEAGQALLAYAHRLLELNDEAVAAVRASELKGVVRLGLPEDLGENILPAVLGRFARAHPRVQIEVSSGKSDELLALYEGGALDLMLRWDLAAGAEAPARSSSRVRELLRLPLHWIGPAHGRRADLCDQPWSTVLSAPPGAGLPQPWQALPLVLLTEPCPMRGLVTDTLSRHGLPWRHAFASASLAASWAAVASGLGLGVRTRLGLPAHVRAIAAEEAPALPGLPSMSLMQHCQSRQAQVLQLAQMFELALRDEEGA
ncbi:MAG: LysR family transcriptional regulator [Burkholderiaceae bacterium]|nr:MAG: LysR family transcriptional regulator [Burkholderiaceae bacterium]